MKSFSTFKKSKNYRKLLPFAPAIVVIAGFAITGLILTIASRAATYTAPKEAEAGVVNGVAAPKTVAAASGGQYIAFGATGGGTTPPPVTPPSTDPTAASCPNPTPIAPVTGYTIAKCEDFNNGLGAFEGYDGGGGDTVVGAGRQSGKCTNSGGALILSQESDGATCGGSTSFSQKYGYWEVRMKTYSTGTGGGSAPHPVLILWPDTDVWADGELDYFETDLGQGAGGFLHCIGNPADNCYTLPDNDVDYTQYHVYGLEWKPGSMTGYIDGEKWWTSTDGSFQPKVSMHQTIQLDNLSGDTPVKAGKMEVDWMHMYK